MSSRQAFTALSQTRNSEEDALCTVCILLHYLISPHSATNGITDDLCIPKPILRHQPLCHQSSLTWQLCIIFPLSLSLLSPCRSLSNYPLSLNKLPLTRSGTSYRELGKQKSLSLREYPSLSQGSYVVFIWVFLPFPVSDLSPIQFKLRSFFQSLSLLMTSNGF